MASQTPWSPTAHAFAHHQFSHVANFWKQGRQASFRLEVLPGGQAELNLTFRLPPASEVVPPPTHVHPLPAAQRPIHPLFPKESDADFKKVSSRRRKSFRRSVLHRAAMAAPSHSPPKNCSPHQAAQACVQRPRAASASPVSAKKRPLSDSPTALSPSSLLPLAQRIRSDIQIGESDVESPEKEILRSSPIPQNSPFPISPCAKGLPSPAHLVFTPVPPEKSSCWTCEAELTPDHQCETKAPCPNCEKEMELHHQCDEVPLASSPVMTGSVCDKAKTESGCGQSKILNCDELATIATTGQGIVLPAKTDLPRRTPGRILNLKKFCETCDDLVSISHKCIT